MVSLDIVIERVGERWKGRLSLGSSPQTAHCWTETLTLVRYS
jgi:hypothetical protein